MWRNHTEQAESTPSVNTEGHLTLCKNMWSRLKVDDSRRQRLPSTRTDATCGQLRQHAARAYDFTKNQDPTVSLSKSTLLSIWR